MNLRVRRDVTLVSLLMLFAGVAPGQGEPPSAPTSNEVRAAAAAAQGLKVVVSVGLRRLWVIDEYHDTLLIVPVAVGTGQTLRDGARHWSFETPPSMRTVVRKDTNPVWIPPDWYYVELAREKHARLALLDYDQSVLLPDGRALVIRRDTVGVIDRARGDSSFLGLPVRDPVLIDSVLYEPPLGTVNRRVPGELGKFRLDLGDGFGLHGTPHLETIGQAATHGCIRLRAADIAWLNAFVPVGTRVFIY